ncbi:hypothetical protein C6497_08470 [Candidatus Poribacteria bacterium]|nr:MAG: hypothetical protein C6497_08470 [Candidatus Poribacteria bacterium]
MNTKLKKTPAYRYILFFLLLLSVFCIYLLYHPKKTTQVSKRISTVPLIGFVPNPPLPETPRFMKVKDIPSLSTQKTKQLDQLKTEASAYTKKLKNGEIEFSVTLYRQSQPEPVNLFVELWNGTRNWLNPPNEITAEKPQTYDVIGEWHITFRFDKDTEFFDVIAHNKQEMNGSQILTWSSDRKAHYGIWRNTHHQFLRDKNQTLYIRNNTVWKPYYKWRQSLHVRTHIPHFDQRYSPYWWLLGHTTDFNTFIRQHKTTDIKTVDFNGSSHAYLQVYHTEQVKTTFRAKTIEFWMHPQAGFLPKRILIGTRTAAMFPEYEEGWMFSKTKPIPGKYTYSESLDYRTITSELAQYEPGIWFPETVTEVDLSGASLSDLFSDLPHSDYPVIMTEALLPQWFREEFQNPPRLKRVMKVHRAVFNLPNLQIPP